MIAAAENLQSGNLQNEAERLRQRAAAMRAAYDRVTWFRFSAVFIPVPFVLVLLRLEIDTWHYYLFGGFYLLFGFGLFTYDTRQSDRVKAAEKQAADAERASEEARGNS
jgi:hypothetical protein